MPQAGRFNPPLSVKAWSAATTGATTNSAVLNTYCSPFVTAAGNVSGACTVYLMLSIDGTTFYQGPSTVMAGAGNFYLNATVGVQWVALQTSSSVTATAVLSAKEG